MNPKRGLWAQSPIPAGDCPRFSILPATLWHLCRSLVRRVGSATEQAAKFPPTNWTHLVAPIALYPDPMSPRPRTSTYSSRTNPAPAVAGKGNPGLKVKPRRSRCEAALDPRHSGVAGLPEVVKRCRRLFRDAGFWANAFLAQQSDVMECRVSVCARMHKDTGNLKSHEQQQVATQVIGTRLSSWSNRQIRRACMYLRMIRWCVYRPPPPPPPPPPRSMPDPPITIRRRGYYAGS